MKHLSLFQLIVAGALILLVAVGFTAWQWYAVFDAYRSMNSEPGVSAEVPPPKRSLPILAGLTPPEALKDKLSNLTSSPFPFPPTKPELVSLERLREAAAGLPVRGLDPKVEIELLKRLINGIASLPVLDPKADDFDFDRGSPNFRETRETARYWYLIGRLQADARKGRQALTSMLGVALLGRLLDPARPNESALISRMIRCACQGLAAAGLIEIAPGLNLTTAELSSTIAQLERIEEGLPIVEIFDAERRNLSELAKASLRKAAAGSPLHRRQEALMRMLADEAAIEPYFKKLYGPLLEAAKLPFKQAWPKVQEHRRVLEEFQVGLSRPGHILMSIFRPKRAAMEVVISLAVPNLSQAYAMDVKARQSIRGASAALAVHAFHNQQGRWPANLAEVETWLGRTFPPDLFTDAPLQFKTGEPPRLFSPGRDLAPDTDDDLVFIPLGGIAPAGSSAGGSPTP